MKGVGACGVLHRSALNDPRQAISVAIPVPIARRSAITGNNKLRDRVKNAENSATHKHRRHLEWW